MQCYSPHVVQAMRLLHPSARRLRHWLDHGEPHDVDRHVGDCSRCATRLEELRTGGVIA